MKIDFKNDVTRAMEETEGSDGRLNVSARTDERGYYNSRDLGLCFSVAFQFDDAAAGEMACYWKNISPTKTLVISSIGINSDQASKFKLHFVDGTAAAGTTLEPTNLNGGSSHAAESIAMEGGSAATGITGLTTAGLIDCAYVSATGHQEFRLSDRLRLGQNDAIVIEYAAGTTGDCAGVIFGYYE